MLTVLASITEVTDEEFQVVTGISYLDRIHDKRTALTLMAERDSGTIV